MDETKRSGPRRYPPFGEVPAAVEGSPELRLKVNGAAASLTGFVCSPSGLFATLRTAVHVPEGGGITYAFAERQRVDNAVEVWAVAHGSGSASEDRLHANLLSGGGGTEGTLHAALFHLWFPVKVVALTDDLLVEMAWPGLNATVQLSIAAASLQQAATTADTRFTVS